MPFQVLVVDDSEINRAVMAEILAEDGYAVEMATGGAEALASIKQRPPDLVLLDVMMPEVSGIDVCREIRSTPGLAEIFVILVTALADRDSRLAGFEAGADDYLAKPVDPAELRLRLLTMARLKRYRSLLEQRSRSAMVTDESPDAVLICSADGRVESGNPAARQAFTALGGSGKPLVVDVIRPVDTGDAAWLAGTESTPAGRPRVMRTGVGRHERVLLVSRTRHIISDNHVFIVIARDVTELERLRVASNRRHRHEAIGRAAAGIAHDFRNLLTGVRMGLGLLTAHLPNNVDAALAAAEEIDAQIDIGVDLTRKITAAARDEKANGTEPSLVDLNALIQDMAPLLRHWAGELSDLSIEPGACPRIWADRDTVFQVLSNLVVNASQAIAPDGRVVVRTYADSRGDVAEGVLEVTDNGCGMDAATQERIFDHYFSTKTAQGGTGLGLATVYEIVTAVGGTIDVESAVGRGTTFRIRWRGQRPEVR